MASQYNRSLSIGDVFGLAFKAIRTSPGLLFGTAFLLSGLPQGVIGYVQSVSGGDSGRAIAAELRNGSITPGMLIGAGVAILVLVVPLMLVGQAIMTRASIVAMSGHQPTLNDSLAIGFRRLLPLLGVIILSVLGVGLGMILLIVPGIMLAMVWYVVTPVVVNEQIGVIGTFERSADLTRGSRWMIFGLAILAACIGIGISMAIGGVGIGLVAMTGNVSDMAAPGGETSGVALIMACANAITNTLTGLIGAVLPAAAYIDLREALEGPETATLDNVFA